MDRGAGRAEEVILDKGKNPGSPSDARKIRKDEEKNEIGERSMKMLEEDVEAEMTESKQRSGLEKAETHEMYECQTPRWAGTWQKSDLTLSKGTRQRERIVKHRGRQTQGARQRCYLVPRSWTYLPIPYLWQESPSHAPALQDFQQNEELLWKAAERG